MDGEVQHVHHHGHMNDAAAHAENAGKEAHAHAGRNAKAAVIGEALRDFQQCLMLGMGGIPIHQDGHAADEDPHADEEEHRQVAEMFNTNLVEIETKEQRRKAFRDIIYAVKHSGYERQKKELKLDDPDYLTKTIQGKKELEKLSHADISPDD